MRSRLVLLAPLAALLIAACGGDDDGAASGDGDAATVLADRILRIGEELGTGVETVAGGLPGGLQLALNEETAQLIDSAVEERDARLDTIAEAAGMSPDEFVEEWARDRAGAFGRFADGAVEPRTTENGGETTPLDDLFIDELVALPVHPDGTLVGSLEFDRPDGSRLFFLVYDVLLSDSEVEARISEQLDESPWQVVAGSSSEDLVVIGFTSTISENLQGSAIVQIVEAAAADASADAIDAATAEGDDEAGPASALSSLVYVIDVQPASAVERDYVLPAPRPIPEGFPASELILDGTTAIDVNWASAPGQEQYDLTLLTTEPAFDVVDRYRDAIAQAGLQLDGDTASGFATILEFSAEDGSVQGTATIDAFVEDDDYTAVRLQLLAASGAGDDE